MSYTWDANGNLLYDGNNHYQYDTANRLVEASPRMSQTIHRYFYNGLGDRLRYELMFGANTTRVDYSLDIASSLSQVLASSGTGDPKGHTYLYGLGRLSQETPSQREYFLGDALGSVRQLVDNSGEVQLVKSYELYGEVLSASGDVASSYAFAGEWLDGYIELLNLRSRMYSPRTGIFLTKDSWQGDYTRPLSLNGWNYVEANPINRTDPSGKWYCQSGFIPLTAECRSWVENSLEKLEISGTAGKKLVDFFHFRDQALTIVGDLVCQPLPMLNGIKIYFEPYITGWRHSYALTIWPDQIHINSSLPGYYGPTPTTKAVVTFGHEISHLAQGGFLPSLSVQAEVLATIVGYYLEGDLGSIHGEDGLFIISNRLDPWSIADLARYDDYYLRIYGSRLPYLLWGNDGISRNWLNNWTITLPYPISIYPRPEPIPTPPPPFPPPTPVPPGF